MARYAGPALLVCALLFNLFLLAPERQIGRVPLNDGVLHLAASERLAESFSRGEPLLDPWVSEWSLGYPFWRSYQPLPHLAAAMWLRAFGGFTDHATAFALLEYLLVSFLPVSVYYAANVFGLGSAAGGLAALLVLTPNGAGEFGRYGLGYGASVWRGSGLFTQVVALHFFVLSLAFVRMAVDAGRRRATAAALIAATALSHIVFAYVAVVSAAVVTVIGPSADRSRRLVRFATVIGLATPLVLWFYAPLALVLAEINHSRWEDPFKWNSFGAAAILRELSSGRLLDADRFPILSLFSAIGVVAAMTSLRKVLSRRLLALAAVWLLLYFGRATWGRLLLLAAIPADLHLHRLQAALEVSLVLLAAAGLESIVMRSVRIDRRLGVVVTAVISLGIIALGFDRALYLRTNAEWGQANLAAFDRSRADLNAALADVRQILAERPGRVSAGKAGGFGNRFKIGFVPVYAFLTREHLDQVSFLYHAMSLTSDVMVLRDEMDGSQEVTFGIRAVVAPASEAMPPHLRLRGVHGRFAVYESSPEGYFGLVDVNANYDGPRDTFYDANAAWLSSPLRRAGIVVALGEDLRDIPRGDRIESLRRLDPTVVRPRGIIVSETKNGETYAARVAVVRPCYALVKITWFPGLVARVDGRTARLLRVTPGFGAVALTAGEHDLVVRYEPGALKPILLVGGFILFVCVGFLLPSDRR